MTKEECLLVAYVAENYPKNDPKWWVMGSCPIDPEDRGYAFVMADLPIETLNEYG